MPEIDEAVINISLADIAIINVSLAEIGEAPISSIDQNTSTARKVKAMYPLKRDELLRMHPWAFAKTRVLLAESEETPAWGYSKYFIIPGDCLRILDLDTGREQFNKEGNYIACDSSSVGMLYIKRVKDTAFFDATFRMLLSKYLSAHLAWSVKGSRTLRTDLMNEFRRDLALARGYSATEGTPKPMLEYEGDGTIVESAQRGRISSY